MKKLIAYLFIFAGLLFSNHVFAQIEAERILSVPAYKPGETMQIDIKITGPSGAIDIIEVPPAGWTINRVIYGTIVDDKITWDLTSFNGSKTVIYFLDVPVDAVEDVAFSGTVDNQEIGGVVSLSVMRYEYNVYLPPEYGQEEKMWPLLLTLHGADQQAMANLDLAKSRFIQVSPQNPIPGYNSNNLWSNVSMKYMLDQVMADYHYADKSRIYVTGFSLGGGCTWSFANDYPEFITAVAPIACEPFRTKAERLINIPVWAITGQKDPVTSSRTIEDFVNKINEAGGNASVSIIPGADHFQTEQEAYNMPELFDWFLQHSKPTQSSVKEWPMY